MYTRNARIIPGAGDLDAVSCGYAAKAATRNTEAIDKTLLQQGWRLLKHLLAGPGQADQHLARDLARGYRVAFRHGWHD